MAHSLTVLSEHAFGDMTARYHTDELGRVGLWLYPTAITPTAPRRSTVANESWVRDKAKARPGITVEPLVHVKITGMARQVNSVRVVHSCGHRLSTDSGWTSSTVAAVQW